ncbi:cellulose synthase [Actinopolymorpha pittospori]|uniref:Cellulose synthase n=1 Tax=Actinopolymorpha pittospori TaxID=648752 RepID=A0A927N8X4_9ACTN|nr:cellulose synthase [Actinopolymorpha pittospori]MBE1611127.1 hypothetical protein [Actinopolymorpha pittospori]
MNYEDVTWAPICAGLTAVGVIAAFFAFRRRGAAAGLRLLGWAVLPMAIFLTGMVKLLWTIGTALVQWVSGFIFSPVAWTGVALFGMAAILLPVAAVLRRRRAAAGAAETATGERVAPAPSTKPVDADGQAAKPAKDPGKPKAVGKGKAKQDDPLAEFEDIDEILKRRGIS